MSNSCPQKPEKHYSSALALALAYTKNTYEVRLFGEACRFLEEEAGFKLPQSPNRANSS